MRQLAGSMLTVVLTALLLSTTDINADHLTYVNTVGSSMRVTGFFRQEVNTTLGTCSAQLDQVVHGGQAFSHKIPGCFLDTLIVEIEGQRIVIKPAQPINRGLFLIRPAGGGYEATGPFEPYDPHAPVVMLINATRLDMRGVVELASGCSTQRTFLAGGLGALSILNLPLSGCPITQLYAEDIGGPGGARTTNSYNSNGRMPSGIFIFREIPRAPFQFEVVGPFPF